MISRQLKISWYFLGVGTMEDSKGATRCFDTILILPWCHLSRFALTSAGFSKFSPERRRGYAQQDLPTHSKCLCVCRIQANTSLTERSEHETRRSHLGSLPGALEIFSVKMKHTDLGREKETQKVLRFHWFLLRPFSVHKVFPALFLEALPLAGPGL